MTKLIVVLLSVVAVSSAMAKEQIVELDIPSMSCPVCPITIKAALNRVEGVTNVETYLEDKLARVTFDDELTDIVSLEKSTTDAGYPSTAKQVTNHD